MMQPPGSVLSTPTRLYQVNTNNSPSPSQASPFKQNSVIERTDEQRKKLSVESILDQTPKRTSKENLSPNCSPSRPPFPTSELQKRKLDLSPTKPILKRTSARPHCQLFEESQMPSATLAALPSASTPDLFNKLPSLSMRDCLMTSLERRLKSPKVTKPQDDGFDIIDIEPGYKMKYKLVVEEPGKQPQIFQLRKMEDVSGNAVPPRHHKVWIGKNGEQEFCIKTYEQLQFKEKLGELRHVIITDALGPQIFDEMLRDNNVDERMLGIRFGRVYADPREVGCLIMENVVGDKNFCAEWMMVDEKYPDFDSLSAKSKKILTTMRNFLEMMWNEKLEDDNRLAQRRMEAKEKAQTTEKKAEEVETKHKNYIGDLKPDNFVLSPDGELVIIDWVVVEGENPHNPDYGLAGSVEIAIDTWCKKNKSVRAFFCKNMPEFLPLDEVEDQSAVSNNLKI